MRCSIMMTNDNDSAGDESSRSVFWQMGDPETSDSLDRSCFLNKRDLLFDQSRVDHNFSSPDIIVPETPSPDSYKWRRRRVTVQRENGAEDQRLDAPASLAVREGAGEERLCSHTSITPSHQRPKRRKLYLLAASSRDGTEAGGHGASSSSLALPSVMEADSIQTGPSHSCVTVVSSELAAIKGSGRSGLRQAELLTHRKRSGGAVPCKSRPKIKSGWDNHDSRAEEEAEELRGLPPVAFLKQEEIVISDDNEDDVVVQAMVYSAQMEEDEAFARSLQAQFDREEQEVEQRRQQARPSSRPTYPNGHPQCDYYGGWSWMSSFSSLMDPSTSFMYSFPQALLDDRSSIRAGHSQAPRSRGSSQRRARRRAPPLLDDSQGFDYDALLAFEESQGPAVAKKSLSQREIQRLPTKAFNPIYSAGKTGCQICFSNYTEGEELRMLPCLHDYHVNCIDRWLKENATCPICRVDVSESGCLKEPA